MSTPLSMLVSIPVARSRTSPSSSAVPRGGKYPSSSRPTIIEISVFVSVPSVGTVPTSSPSLSTVIWLQIVKISRRRWEM